MSRSVSYQPDAVLVKYTHVEPVYGKYNPDTGKYEGKGYNEFETQRAFEDMVISLKESLKTVLPSFRDVPRRQDCYGMDARLWKIAVWECRPILRNKQCAVFISEYDNLISISFCQLAYYDDYYNGMTGLNRYWIMQAEKRIDKAIDNVAERLLLCDRFSNGEAVFAPALRRATVND